jgi:hypothetical protein
MEDTTMEITDFVPKMELRQFLVLVIPGMIFSFTILYPIDKLSCYKLLPVDADFTSVNLPYVSLLIFYLLTSGLVFGVIFQLLYLWRVFPRFIQKVHYFLYPFFQSSIFLWFFSSRAPIKSESTDKFLEYLGEFREILLKSVNIDISYKQVYRTFFGSLSISTLLSFLVLFISFIFFQVRLIFFLSFFLIVVFSLSYRAAGKLTEEVDSADKKLVEQLNKFLDDVKESFPEEVYKNLFKK